MVHLQRFHERLAERGLLVFTLSMEPDPARAVEWNAELGVDYLVLDGAGSALGERLAYG
jgi:hypothetical protein